MLCLRMVTRPARAVTKHGAAKRWRWRGVLFACVLWVWVGPAITTDDAAGGPSDARKSVIAYLTLLEGDLVPHRLSNLGSVKSCSAAGSVLEAWIYYDSAGGFMDADLVRSRRMTEAELIALRSRLAALCLPNQSALAPNLVPYPERWAVAACLRNAYRGDRTRHVEAHGGLYRAWSRIASLHPACVRDLIDHPDAVGSISFEICNEKYSAVPFQAIGEGIGKTSSVLYPGWGELQQLFFDINWAASLRTKFWFSVPTIRVVVLRLTVASRSSVLATLSPWGGNTSAIVAIAV
jgi:hypothetical protein